MQAEIIAVGSEMLSYNRVDTNSLWLAERLNGLGVELAQKCVVGDDHARLVAEIRGALERSGLVVLSGGLGPTEDDLTREAVAEATGRGLEYEESVFRAIEERFARLGRKIAEKNKRQAWRIAGAELLENPNGTAPGQWLEHNGRIVVLLPGPPRELQPMADRLVLPKLRALLPEAHIRTLWLRVAGMGESDLDQLIAPVYKAYENIVTTVLAKAGDLEVHLRARCGSASEAEALVEEAGARIAALLGDRLYSRNGDPMETVVGRLLNERGATLTVAESCTGGLLGGRITEAPGSSSYFLGGYLVYGNEVKAQVLGVRRELIEEHGVVSEPVAQAMADGARDRTRATYALSVTGEAGPESGSGAPVGTVVIGLAGPEKVEAKAFRFPGDRGRVRAFAVQTALNLLRLELLAAR